MAQADVIQALLDANARLTEQIVELSKALVDARKPEPPAQYEVSQHPLWIPESEEDARAAFAAGEIDKSELEAVLRELDFLNDTIVFPTAE